MAWRDESDMALTIFTNVSSLNAQRNLSASQAGLTTTMQRLSSGLRVNTAKDDAAGLAIGTKMDSLPTQESKSMIPVRV